MKLVDLQHQALLFRTGALEGMSNESNPEVGGSWGGNLNPKELITLGLRGGRVEGHSTLGPAAPSNPEQLRFKTSEW